MIDCQKDFVTAMKELLKENNVWIGTTDELRLVLDKVETIENVPPNYNQMGRTLKFHTELLKEEGIIIETKLKTTQGLPPLRLKIIYNSFGYSIKDDLAKKRISEYNKLARANKDKKELEKASSESEIIKNDKEDIKIENTEDNEVINNIEETELDKEINDEIETVDIQDDQSFSNSQEKSNNENNKCTLVLDNRAIEVIFKLWKTGQLPEESFVFEVNYKKE